MDQYAMVVIIVGLAMAFAAYDSHLKHKRKSAAQTATDDDLRRQVVELEARVATLEKIATDPSERLKRSIEELEDA